MADGQVLIEIQADNRGVKQTLRDTTTDLKNAGQEWEKQGDKMSGIFGKVAAAITAAGIGKALLNIGREAVQAASDLEEVQNVVDVTFGKASAEIDSWAKNAIQQFGLTETQAKRYASTIGAMMKSSGVAGDEIVGMSEDLAGLAADMASFYNLDFDTAFQKIRSGISGETEPLKQLGINMSVVNLEAYAMTQGITKSFQEMSQGEQVMLRYQYMMQATADAQGDFARTSDGFANATRLFESSLDSLKAKLGGPIMQGLADVLSTINGIYDKLFNAPQKRTTILDTFAQIDADAQERIATVKATAEDARELVNILTGLNNSGFAVDAISNIATGANKLDSTSPGNWSAILGAFADNLPGFSGTLASLPSPTTVQELATALSGIDGAESKQQAWHTMLYALSENADGIARMMNTSPQHVLDMLAGIATQASRIDENDAQAWDDLLTAFATSFPGLLTSATLEALGTSLNGIATAGNSLRSSSRANWTAFLTACQGLDGLSNIWSGEVGGISSLAEALSTSGITQSRAQAWQTMLEALKSNIGAIAAAHGGTEDETIAWLDSLAVAANRLDPGSAAGWDTLFSWLVEGLPQLSSTPEGQALLDALNGSAQGEGQVTQASSAAVDVMEMLGIATDDVNDQQSLWLATCRELVRLIPSLSRIINTETGEIIGGAQAVRDYIDAWEADNVRQIYIDALQRKIDEYNALVNAGRVDSRAKRAVLRSQLGGTVTQGTASIGAPGGQMSVAADDFLDSWGRTLARMGVGRSADTLIGIIKRGGDQVLGDLSVAYNNMTDRQKAAFEEWVRAVVDEGYYDAMIPRATAELEAAIEEVEQMGIDAADALAESYGEIGDAAGGATIAVRELTEEQQKGWEAALKAVEDAAAAVDEYRRATVEATRQTLRAWGNMFDEILSNDDRTRRQIEHDLEDFEGDREIEFEVRVGTSDIRTAQNMLNNLRQRAAYLENYAELMAQAADLGYSAEVLAQLADGSLGSYDILRALVAGGSAYVDQINEAYAEVGSNEEQLAETLAGYRLETDEAFQALVETLQAAMNDLDAMVPTDAPALAVAGTMQQVLDVIGAMYPSLSESVSRVNAAIARLGQYAGTGVRIGGGHIPGVGGFRVTYGIDGSHAGGLDSVPFDGYLAQLHRGESVLTAQEAQVWREFRAGLDTNSIASAIWDNSPDMGGNVYLNGEVVGRIMSAQQADSYRQLERSGWRG